VRFGILGAVAASDVLENKVGCDVRGNFDCVSDVRGLSAKYLNEGTKFQSVLEQLEEHLV
jgi:hypothetical protein